MLGATQGSAPRVGQDSISCRGKEIPLRVACVILFLWSVSGVVQAAGGDGDGDEKKPAPPSGGESNPSERIDRLEKEIQELKAAEAARKAGLPAALTLGDAQAPPPGQKGDLDFRASFTDGFHMKSTDGNF